MMKTKICNKCKKEKLLSEFHKKSDNKDGLRYKCKDCANKYRRQWFLKNRKKVKEYNQSKESHISQKKYQQTKKGQKNAIKKVKIYRQKYPEKHNSQSKFQYAIKINKIKRPNKCNQCNKRCKPDGHHPDYNKPLEVIWLCKQCHSKLHKGE